MTWTTAKPTTPGWYWWRAVGATYKQIEMVHCSGPYMRRFVDEFMPIKFELTKVAGDWAGPLEPPTS